MVVGDRVRLEPEPTGEVYGVVGVEPRTTLLERRVPEGRGTRPVAANIDEVFVVTATVDPAPIPQLIDRLLVVAEANSIPAAVVVNKIELDPGRDADRRAAARRLHRLSHQCEERRRDRGIRQALCRARSRSSPGRPAPANRACSTRFSRGSSSASARSVPRCGRGKNTTVSAVMLPLDAGGFLVDTPGFSEVGLWGVEPRELASAAFRRCGHSSVSAATATAGT